MKRWLTTSNVLATIAMLCALTGTSIAAAWAAPLLTGANVRNGTLTGVDVKDLSLSSTDFTSAATTQLRAQTGPVGDKGPVGPTGSKGAKGRKGTAGVDAAKAYSYITADDTTSFVSPKTGSLLNPDPVKGNCVNAGTVTIMNFASNCTPFAPYFPHWKYDCDAALSRYCGSSKVKGSAGAGATLLQTNSNGVVGFTGDENGSFVSLMGPGNVLVTASLTLMHPEEDLFHSRIACQPQVRRSNTADAYTNLGVPTIASSADSDELVHITVTGAARFIPPTNESADYDFQVTCQMLDEYSSGTEVDNWFFISGNATATTTEL
ncbi:MAG: hypothetical protein JWL76_1703 [Thermoleophilia bacterium]|nr:hypothetical protein [Thermoleophilia bacterium]